MDDSVVTGGWYKCYYICNIDVGSPGPAIPVMSHSRSRTPLLPPTPVMSQIQSNESSHLKETDNAIPISLHHAKSLAK